MNENIKNNGPRSYRERFEFVFTFGDNIICQRYFKINNFNPASLRSYELTEAVRRCVSTINSDLKNKTQAYLEMYAPMVFNSENQMEAFFSNPNNWVRMTLGEGIVIKGNKETDYAYLGDGKVKALGYKFDDGELTQNSAEDGKVTYKFAFKVDGEERCVVIWDGFYPKFVRDKVDISNKRGKFDGDDVNRLSFEQYLLYRMVKDRPDLVYGIINNICKACSKPISESSDYTTDVDDILDGWNESNYKDLLRINNYTKEENE